jgi:hypothetical protein
MNDNNKGRVTSDDVCFRLGISEEDILPPSLEAAIQNHPSVIWELLNRSEQMIEDGFKPISQKAVTMDFLLLTGKRPLLTGYDIMRNFPTKPYRYVVKRRAV